MKIYFSVLAQKELQDAIAYYDEISSALGDELIQELRIAEKLILFFPLSWTKAGKNQRKYTLKRFPYVLIYRAYYDRIIVAAFANQHRKPQYYINQKKT